jgi:hypothetical protein
VGAVKEMENMFRNADAFNQNLNGWCLPLITSEPENFGNSNGTNPTWGQELSACTP